MPPDESAKPLTLTLLGPEQWAGRVADELRISLQGASIRILPDLPAPDQTPSAADTSAVVARLAAETSTAPLTALLQRADAPPLVLCATDDTPAEPLLTVMGAGATALVRDGDGAALTAAVRRARAVGHGQQPASPAIGLGASRAAAPDALATLADRIAEPVALVRDALVVHVNPVFRDCFGLTMDAAVAGRPLADFAAPDAARPLAALLSRALLLDLDDQAQETLRFVPAAGAAFAAEVLASPLAIGTGHGLAVVLRPTGARAGIGTRTAAAPSPDDERAALLERLAVLTDDGSPVERTAVLVLACVTDYAGRRRELGFAGAAGLLQALSDCLRAAAPAESTLYRVAEDALAILAEDIGPTEFERVRRRLADVHAEAAEPAVRASGLQLGVSRVAPGAGTPAEVLDRALRDAVPAEADVSESPETTEGLDLLEAGYSIDVQAGSTLAPDSRPPTASPPAPAAAPRAAPTAPTASIDHADAPALPRLGLDAEPAASGATVLVDGLMERIRRALEGEGFMIALQPIISLMGDSREHYSVLVRLRRPDGGLADATQIMHSAASSGRMADIDRWVIRSALRLLSQRRRAGEKAAFFLSLSPELVADDGLLIWLCDALREFEIRGSWVTFQMQDQQALAQPERWSDFAAGLREVRCRTCINQYGLVDAVMGEARVAPDFVKFAPSLAAGLSANRDKQHRLLELIRLVRNRGISSIITGIEDSRSLNLLWDAGIEYLQGDYLQEATTRFDGTTDTTEQSTGAGPSSEPLSLRL